MNSPGFALLAWLLLVPASHVVAGNCPAVATALPEPPQAQGLYPVRLVRADGRAADPTPRDEMFRSTRNNDGDVPLVIFSAPSIDPATDTRSQVRFSSGRHTLQVIERIPNDALTPLALKNRRWAGAAQPKALVLDVVEGQEYAIAARLVPGAEGRTRANAHWEPVVWRAQARVCR